MADVLLTMPMVINTAFGGYSLSREAQQEIARRKGLRTRIEDGFLYIGDQWDSVDRLVPRNDPDLIAVVREMGARAGRDLKIVEVTVCLDIESHDGMETVRVSGGVY